MEDTKKVENFLGILLTNIKKSKRNTSFISSLYQLSSFATTTGTTATIRNWKQIFLT